MKFHGSALATTLCVGSGLEIGGSAHNPFGLDTRNVDITGEHTMFKERELELCGECLPVDIIAPGDDIPLPDESVDFVVSSHVLEHFTDPLGALVEWDRLVKVGGVILAIVPHKERTFDNDRERTPLEHVIADWGANPASDGREHQHVWITEDVVAMCDWLMANVVCWEWLAVQDTDDKVGNGFTVAVRKVATRCTT